jgi:hypothetical protein
MLVQKGNLFHLKLSTTIQSLGIFGLKGRWCQSMNLGEFMNPKISLLPKHIFILMTVSTSVQF